MRKGNKIKKLPDFGESQAGQVKEIFFYTVRRNFINICKRYLNLTESLRLDHDVFIKKLEKSVSKEDLEKLDYLDETKYNYIRKQVLDAANDAARDIENYGEMLDIELKKEKGKNG